MTTTKTTTKIGTAKGVPVVTKNGETKFNEYVNELTTIQSMLDPFIERWNQEIGDCVGNFKKSWLELLARDGVWSGIEAAVYRRASEVPAHQQATYASHYLEKAQKIINDGYAVSTRIQSIFNETRFPWEIRNMTALPIGEDGRIDVRSGYFESVRPLFDEVLRHPDDIEYYHIMHETAAALTRFIFESKKRKVAILGHSYIRMFMHHDDGQVVPVTDNLKFILSQNKPG